MSQTIMFSTSEASGSGSASTGSTSAGGTAGGSNSTATPSVRDRNGNNNVGYNGISNSTNNSASDPLEEIRKDPKPNLRLCKALDTSAKRIQTELPEITLDPPPNCSAGPQGDKLHEWVSTIFGSPGSVYKGGIFFL